MESVLIQVNGFAGCSLEAGLIKSNGFATDILAFWAVQWSRFSLKVMFLLRTPFYFRMFSGVGSHQK